MFLALGFLSIVAAATLGMLIVVFEVLDRVLIRKKKHTR